MEAARRPGQRFPHSRSSRRASHCALTARQPGQSQILVSFQRCSELLAAEKPPRLFDSDRRAMEEPKLG